MADREPNRKECSEFVKRMNTVVTDIQTVGEQDYILLRSKNADELYGSRGPDGRPALAERVLVAAFGADQDNWHETLVEFDLEDLLRFAAKYCRGIYDRVGKEETKA